MQESTKHHDNDYANKEMELPDVKEEIDVKEEEQNEMVEDTTSGKQVDTADAFVDGKQEKEAEAEVVQADISDTTNEDTDENVVKDNGGEKDTDQTDVREETQEDTKDKDVEETENTENCIDGKEETEVEMQEDIADSTNEKEDTDENMVQEDGGEKDIDEARENE
uniref:Uncharacterized protein n=1 Tax=Ditylum brightwellii TaxID=49249 RepID=A0A7S4QMX3_9STRA